MTQRHWLVWCLQLGRVGLLGWIGAIAFASSTLAQSRIVPDNTLGADSSIVTPNVQGSREEITGGAVTFSNGCKLILLPNSEDDVDLPYWEIFTPDQMVLKVGPGAIWSYTSSNSRANENNSTSDIS